MNDIERVELNELCSGLVDGVLDERQRARLQELLRGSEEARRFYVSAMHLSSSLHSYASEMLSEAAEPANVVRPTFWGRPLVALAAVAAIILGLWVGRIYFSEPSTTDDAQADTVAQITGGKDCEWKGAVLETGDEVGAGQRLELVRGFAELTFDCGAQVMIEGPAILDVRSAWEMELMAGTLKANVPEEAAGFRVTNPSVEVVDLGTEFSITASNGEAEVFVLKGSVEVHPKDAAGNRKAKSVLREKQAKRFAGARTHDVNDSDAKFLKLAKKVVVEPIKRPFTYARWSFDENGGVKAESAGSADGAKAFTFDRAPAWGAGRFGNAVKLDGATGAHAELAGSLRRGAKTVAFWTRVPAGATLSDSGAFVSVPMNKSWAWSLNLAWNRAPGEGVFGALRMEAAPGSIVGSTNLRDGRWHHVAAVFGSNLKPGTKPRVKLYVDGRLESLSYQRALQRPAEKAAAVSEGALWLGGSAYAGERFVGEMDELVLADQQLSPQQIRHLMHTNLMLSYDALTRF